MRFDWEPMKQIEVDCWTKHYDELVSYKVEHGDCNVPTNYSKHKSLGFWIASQRTALKNRTLAKERVRKLNEIGFIWKPMEHNSEVSWKSHYDELVAYKGVHGDCNVPWQYKNNRKLANWVTTQRTAYKNGKLSNLRVKKLNVIGFAWS